MRLTQNQNDYCLGENFWKKIEKSSKTGQETKSLISTFVYFFTFIARV